MHVAVFAESLTKLVADVQEQDLVGVCHCVCVRVCVWGGGGGVCMQSTLACIINRSTITGILILGGEVELHGQNQVTIWTAL